MQFEQIQQRALSIRELYEQLELSRYGRAWTTEEIALGFVGDVGDLMKLVQAESGIRAIPDHRTKLGHELADCLWSLLVLAGKYDINLEAEFLKTMHDLEQHIEPQLES